MSAPQFHCNTHRTLSVRTAMAVTILLILLFIMSYAQYSTHNTLIIAEANAIYAPHHRRYETEFLLSFFSRIPSIYARPTIYIYAVGTIYEV